MDAHEPLSMADAHDLWEGVIPHLFEATVNYIRRAPLSSGAPRRLLLQDTDLHKDIVQETGIAFFMAVTRGRVWRDKATHWLSRVHKRIARRIAKMEAAARVSVGSRRCAPTSSARGESNPSALEIPSNEASPERLVADRQMLRVLASRFEELSDAQRRTLDYLLSGATPSEIAAAEGVEPGVARKRIHDLRSKLRLLVH